MKSISKFATISSVALALGYAVAPIASATDASASGQAQVADAKATMTDGEIKKIDKDAGKLTIKHGPISNLDMPGMTMVFRVGDNAMLDRVKIGDHIQFVVEKLNGALTVTRLEPAQQ
ncbi:copper-binding protein [Undibacterium arcticum]|uniref:Copper-binding protein n=1 Tax=Undibacterium arcticum TaxID=1762892 RepID=A0ABV7F066_9BURK